MILTASEANELTKTMEPDILDQMDPSEASFFENELMLEIQDTAKTGTRYLSSTELACYPMSMRKLRQLGYSISMSSVNENNEVVALISW